MSPTRPALGTTYGDAYAAGREALRKVVLDAAGELLRTEGPNALTMRRIAGEVGCSTTVLYTMFGGKAGLAEGLWLEGFARLAETLRQVEGDDPLDRIARLGRAYRASALAGPAYYAVMFQRPIPGFEPSDEALARSQEPLQVLVDAVEDCIAAGVFRSDDAGHIARVLWAAAHGAVSLELVGYEGTVDAERIFEDAIAAAGTWFLAADQGGDRGDRGDRKEDT